MAWPREKRRSFTICRSCSLSIRLCPSSLHRALAGSVQIVPSERAGVEVRRSSNAVSRSNVKHSCQLRQSWKPVSEVASIGPYHSLTTFSCTLFSAEPSFICAIAAMSFNEGVWVCRDRSDRPWPSDSSDEDSEIRVLRSEKGCPEGNSRKANDTEFVSESVSRRLRTRGRLSGEESATAPATFACASSASVRPAFKMTFTCSSDSC